MSKDIGVTVSLITGRKYVKRAMLATQGINTIRNKDDVEKHTKWRLTDKVLLPMLLDLHSPIEEMRFWIEIYTTNRVIDHLVRHEEIGKYVASSRPDIDTATDNSDGMRYASFSINGKRLVEIMQQRLCTKAWYETRLITEMIRTKVIEIEPLFAYVLYPKCVWYGFCPLLNRTCGLPKEAIISNHNMFIGDIERFINEQG